MSDVVRFKLLLFLLALSAASVSFGASPKSGRVEISYWEKWNGFEGEAMRAVVDRFNGSQDRIHVNFLSVGNVDRKTLLAIAGGDPPDVAGLYFYDIAPFVDQSALLSLDDWCREARLGASYYKPVYWDMCRYRGQTWALPSTPLATGLYWNKAMFRDAGLDPDRPPRTVAELDAFAEKLTKRDARGKLQQLGFLPQEPGWYAWAFGVWFGGEFWDGKGRIECDSEYFIHAYNWAQSYTKKIGLEDIRGFTSGFGNFASPQNPFLSGQVAMVLQGVWMHNYISQYAPGLEYGVAAWPTAAPGRENFSVVDCDMLTVPRGAKHPREAFEFIRYVQSQSVMEQLCTTQRKSSPLSQVSEQFIKHHPNPNIQFFENIVLSPNASHFPKLGLWQEYMTELSVAFDKIRLLQTTPAQALQYAQRRLQKSLDHELAILRRRGVPPAREEKFVLQP